MTTMHDALVSAGAGEAKARRAAEQAADHEQGFDRLERRLDAMQSGLGRRLDVVQSGLEQRIDVVQSGLERRIDAVQSGLEQRIGAVHSNLDKKIVEQGGRLLLLQWMFGLLVGGVAAILIKLFV